MTRAEERVRDLGRKRARARRTLKEISDDLPEAVRALHDEGVQKKRIAELAQVSRPALDHMLKHRDP